MHISGCFVIAGTSGRPLLSQANPWSMSDYTSKSNFMRVLIVEDNPDVAEMLAILVHALGHSTQVCHYPAEAIETAKRWLPQLVITDIGLPGMDGYELAPMLHHQQGLSRVPIYSVMRLC